MTEASGQHFQDPTPTQPPKLYPPLPVSTDKKRREMLELSRLRSARVRGNKREQTRELQCKLLLWESLSRALRKTSSALGTGQFFNWFQGRPRAHYSQTSVPGAKLWATGRMNALRQGRKRKLLQLWGLLTWKLNRAARAQRFQVPESPW